MATPPAAGTVPDVVRPRSSEKDEQILLAATTLIAEHGYPVVTVADIAKQAQVGLSTVYLRFPSKEALGNAVYRRCEQAWAQSTLDKVPTDATPADQFHTYWRHLHQFATTHPEEWTYAERGPSATPSTRTPSPSSNTCTAAQRLVDSWLAASPHRISREVAAAPHPRHLRANRHPPRVRTPPHHPPPSSKPRNLERHHQHDVTDHVQRKCLLHATREWTNQP